jgi:CheY-like chemotaxis protein
MLNSDETILLIEDDRVDIMTVQRALEKNAICNPLHVARTGIEALHMLRGEDGKIKITPALILLDLNLPKMSGIEFLHQVRNDPALRELRIIVLTSSNEPKDRDAAFAYDVDDYIVKPHSFEKFSRAIATVLALWD